MLPARLWTVPIRIPVFAFILYITIREEMYVAVLSIILVLIGTILNLVAMSVNGWKMPVAETDTVQMNSIWGSKTHDVLTSTTKLKFLCDVIKIGPRTLSVGDILCLLGIVGVIINWFVVLTTILTTAF